MARSKVGGSSGKLKGQVGDVVYQVKKNSDGTYTQYVYSKGERTEETITPTLQAQRMCTAMVQSIMKDLKEVWRLSWQNARTKIASLNEMSSFNLRLVLNDAHMHWYEDSKFIYPMRYRTDINVKDLGGVFRISQGTLLKNIFDAELWDDFPYRSWQGVRSYSDQLYGVQFDAMLNRETVASFMSRHRMTYSDQIVCCGFRDWVTYTPDHDDPTEHYKNVYFIAGLNMQVPRTSILTAEILEQLFMIKSSLKPRILIGKDNNKFAISWVAQFDEIDEQFFYMATFSISYWSGRKQVKTSTYHNPDGGDDPWYLDSCPAMVFGSWMDEYWHKPYPYPW